MLHTSPLWMEEEKSVLEKAVDNLKEKKSMKVQHVCSHAVTITIYFTLCYTSQVIGTQF